MKSTALFVLSGDVNATRSGAIQDRLVALHFAKQKERYTYTYASYRRPEVQEALHTIQFGSDVLVCQIGSETIATTPDYLTIIRATKAWSVRREMTLEGVAFELDGLFVRVATLIQTSMTRAIIVEVSGVLCANTDHQVSGTSVPHERMQEVVCGIVLAGLPLDSLRTAYSDDLDAAVHKDRPLLVRGLLYLDSLSR